MQKKQAFEEGFLTQLIYDTNNPEFDKDELYYCMNKLEVYYTNDGIIGLFPSFENREMNKKIEANSFYLEFQKNLIDIKYKLNSKNIELKHEITNLDDFVQNVKIIYDENKQIIKAVKFSCNKRVNVYGNFTLFNKKDFVLLMKRNHFITGLKTSYLKNNEGIPYLSYIQCYFAKFTDYDKYYYHNDGSYCSHLFDRFLNALIVPFVVFDKCFCAFLRVSIVFLKISFIISLILGLPVYYYWRSQNILSGKYTVTGKNSDYEIKNIDSIKIFTDENGFSHIKAESTEDAYFALGFEHAKHRLFQIDVNRRIARGTLSEIFGKRSLEIDKLMRSFGYNNYSLKAVRNFRKYSKFQKEVDAYVSGINYFGNNFKLPIEYYIAGASFYNFTVADTIAIMAMSSYSMNNDYDIEILYQFLEREMGKEFAENVFHYRDADYPFWNQTIVNDLELTEIGLNKNRYTNYNNDNRKNRNEQVDNNLDNLDNLDNKINNGELNKNESKKEEKNKIDDSFIGNKLNNAGASNCWNIDGRYTKSGKPMLCNDPHLSNSQPNLLFVVKIYLPNMVISGATFVGAPVFITGSNSFISWGVTTENSDNTDFCEEIIQGDYYIKNNKNYPLTKVKEIIKVKGSEPVEIEVKYTENGPIFGKYIPSSFSLFNEDFENNLPLSFRMGFMRHEFTSYDFYFRLVLAKSPQDFIPYKNECLLSNYNLHWVSREGQIGYITLGIINLKKYQNRFCHGFSSQDDIINEIPQEEMLSLTSPKKGYIISGNNSPASNNYLYKLVGNHNNARAYRVNELLNDYIKNNTKISINESITIMKDIHDANAAYILPKYLDIIKRNLNAKELKENAYYQILKKWNFQYDMESREATLFTILERNLCILLLTKKISIEKAKPLLNFFPMYKFIHGIIDKVYNGEKIVLKECAFYNRNDDCEKYLVNVFKHLDEYVKDFKETSGLIKKWGTVNYNYFPHTPFDDIPILKYLYSKKKYASGSRNTIKISRSPGNHKMGEFVATQTPRFQFICDMKEPEEPYLMLSGGNGGSPMQMYYNNFMDKFESNEMVKFKKIDFDDEKNKERIITLEKRF